MDLAGYLIRFEMKLFAPHAKTRCGRPVIV
jgi:hypothetical protein